MSGKKSQDRLKNKISGSIQRILRKSGKQQLNYKQISAKLKLSKPHERMLVSVVLAELKAKHLVEEPSLGKFRAVASKMVQVRGPIEITRRGAGYVSTDLFENDVFIDEHIISEYELNHTLRGKQPIYQSALDYGIII